jgi:3-dehydro-L-gulonate 2-dehydrogenase
MLRIPFEEMEQTICRAFIKARLTENTAAICARIHTESSCDGEFSHELNRVERLVD